MAANLEGQTPQNANYTTLVYVSSWENVEGPDFKDSTAQMVA